MLMEVNEYLLAHKDDDKDDHTPPSGGKTNDDGTAKEDTHKGTLTLDATCAPANIRYPQDISILNETREKLENMIYRFCKCYGLKLPRRYRKRARKEYLAFAKSRKHTAKKIRSALRSHGSGRSSEARSKHRLNLVQNLISVLTAKVMGVSKKYLSRHTTRAPA